MQGGANRPERPRRRYRARRRGSAGVWARRPRTHPDPFSGRPLPGADLFARKEGVVEAAIEPAGVDNEEEAYGRNAGMKRHDYRIAVPMTEIWPDYAGSHRDGLHIEIFETWLERI